MNGKLRSIGNLFNSSFFLKKHLFLDSTRIDESRKYLQVIICIEHKLFQTKREGMLFSFEDKNER
jgi:hypothetical protein